MYEIGSRKPIVDQIKQLKDDNTQLNDLLLEFNHTIERLFIGASVEEFSGICTPHAIEIMRGKLEGWRAQGVVSLRMSQFDFITFQEEMRPEGRCVVAYTYEKWFFGYENGTIRSTNGGINVYQEVWANGAWKVDQMEAFTRVME